MSVEARALLDELMGRSRNKDPTDAPNELRWDDPDICKYFVCSFCPYELFTNTRADLGPCNKIHDEALRKEYQTSTKCEKLGYEDDFIRFLQQLVSDVEKRIRRGHQRLALNSQQGTLNGNPANPHEEKINMLTERVNDLVSQAETLGCEGKVEESQGVMKLVDQLKEERHQLETAPPQENEPMMKQMEVCDVCGAFLIVGDAPQRQDEHLMGKQHAGYAQVRAEIDKRKMKAKARIEEREANEQKVREEREEKQKEREREREERRKKERELERSKEKDRERRHKSSHESSRDRRRSRSKDRGSKRRSRSRDRGQTRRRSGSREKKRSRSRDRRSSRRSSSKDRRPRGSNRDSTRDRTDRDRGSTRSSRDRGSRSSTRDNDRERKDKDGRRTNGEDDAEHKEPNGDDMDVDPPVLTKETSDEAGAEWTTEDVKEEPEASPAGGTGDAPMEKVFDAALPTDEPEVNSGGQASLQQSEGDPKNDD